MLRKQGGSLYLRAPATEGTALLLPLLAGAGVMADVLAPPPLPKAPARRVQHVPAATQALLCLQSHFQQHPSISSGFLPDTTGIWQHTLATTGWFHIHWSTAMVQCIDISVVLPGQPTMYLTPVPCMGPSSPGVLLMPVACPLPLLEITALGLGGSAGADLAGGAPGFPAPVFRSALLFFPPAALGLSTC
jgi:hypothetical protein